jgi:hypothetical protein
MKNPQHEIDDDVRMLADTDAWIFAINGEIPPSWTDRLTGDRPDDDDRLFEMTPTARLDLVTRFVNTAPRDDMNVFMYVDHVNMLKNFCAEVEDYESAAVLKACADSWSLYIND